MVAVAQENTFTPQLHEKLTFLLFEKIRYKVAYGGRGGGKSYSFADAALTKMLSEVCTITVCRELQTSIKHSVHALLKERIAYHGLEGIFTILDNEIRCENGSNLNYKHMRDNITEVKGLQGTKYCWIFEAEAMSKESAKVLFPTIRLPESEIWIEFNPDQEDDFVYQRFVINPPRNSKVVKLTYLDNPKCSPELLEEAEECRRWNEDEYKHVWLGEPSGVGSKIYPMFGDEHIREYNLKVVRKDSMYFMGQDPATVYYPFAVWIARVKRGDEFDYVVYNEFPTLSMMGGKYFHEIRQEKVCNLTLKQRANMFRVLDNTIEETFKWLTIAARAIDTRFVKASGAASSTLATRGLISTMSDPANGGMTFETPPERMIDVQRDRIQALMDYNRDLGLVPGLNEPHFYVMPHCHNVIDAFRHHRVDKDKKTEDQKRKDPIDAIRITMALMAEYAHKEAGSVSKAVVFEPDRVQQLKETFSRGGSLVGGHNSSGETPDLYAYANSWN